MQTARKFNPRKYTAIADIRAWERYLERTPKPGRVLPGRQLAAGAANLEPRRPVVLPFRPSCRFVVQLVNLVAVAYQQRKGSLELRYRDLEALAGCSRGSAQNAVLEARRLELVVRVRRFEKLTGQEPECFMRRARPGQRRREITPLYRPGRALLELMEAAERQAAKLKRQRAQAGAVLEARRLELAAQGEQRRRRDRAHRLSYLAVAKLGPLPCGGFTPTGFPEEASDLAPTLRDRERAQSTADAKPGGKGSPPTAPIAVVQCASSTPAKLEPLTEAPSAPAFGGGLPADWDAAVIRAVAANLERLFS